MEGINRVQLLGNLGADPELKGTGTQVLKLRLATTESYYDKASNDRKERTDWHSVTLFGARATALAKILVKGTPIFVEGRLQTSSYEKDGQKQYRTEVVATNIVLLGGKSGGASQGAAPRPMGARAPEPTHGTEFDPGYEEPPF